MCSASIQCTGVIIKSPAPKQIVEMQTDHIEVLGICDQDRYPLMRSKLELQYLRQYPHLRQRTKTVGDILDFYYDLEIVLEMCILLSKIDTI
jgi:asparaginyl-tRNA synthetase